MLSILVTYIFYGPIAADFHDCGLRYALNRYEAVISFGSKTIRSEFPWHVALYRQYSSSEIPEYICGGSIIHPTVILTAAHCVYNEISSEIENATFTVIAGKHYVSWEHSDLAEQRLKVVKIKIPKTYTGVLNRYADDIALLELNTTIHFSSAVMPVCIDWSSEYLVEKLPTFGTVVGWGLTQNQTTSNELLMAQLKYIEFTKCRDNISNGFTYYVTSDKFCAGLDNGTAVEHGDSGGGITSPKNTTNYKEQYYLYGIVSTKDTGKSNIAAFTDIRKHLKWLNITVLSMIGPEVEICEAFDSPNLLFNCTKAGYPMSCNITSKEKKGMKMVMRCKNGFHKQFNNSFTVETICLENGRWSQRPYDDCSVCGRRYRINDHIPLISHAQKTTYLEYPWHAGLYVQESDQNTEYICGGSIIHPRAILTVAHCVYDEEYRRTAQKKYIVAVGKYNSSWNQKDPLEQRIEVKEVHIHDYYRGNRGRYQHNIAILELEDEIKFHVAVSAVCINWENDLHLDLKPFAVGTVVGWGFTENNVTSEILLVAKLKVYSFIDCENNASSTFQSYITSDKICAGLGNDTMIQPGDSGGGLTFPKLTSEGKEENYLYGLSALKEQSSNKYGLFTRVTDYLGWIERILNSIINKH